MVMTKDNPAELSKSQLAEQLDQVQSAAHSVATGQMEPVADPYAGTHVQRQSLNTYCGLYRGVIQMCLPHINCYRVAIGGMNGTRTCHALMTDSNHALMGPRDTSMYQPYTPVLVHLAENETEGIILGALPEIVRNGNTNFSDTVVQGSNVGIRRDGYYHQYIRTTSDEGGAINYVHHRPLDQTSLDWGRMTETGLGFHLDPMMVMMRVNEMCGVFGFYQGGGAIRVAGFQMDVWSASHTAEYRDDEGECTTYVGEVMYPWEAKGAFDQKTETAKEQDWTDMMFLKPISTIEPQTFDQQPFHRYEEYGGYLGQGHIRQVSAPPKEAKDLLQYGKEKTIPGVFREHIGMDGSYGLAAAKEIHFAKRSVIPIPKRKKLQEDLSDKADNPTNYRPSGTYGSGLEHEIGAIETPKEFPQLTKLAALLDIHTHKFNWKALGVFSYHQLDFQTPEEEDLRQIVGKNQRRPDVYQLTDKWWMDLPEPKKLKIDERYGEIDIYELMSMISMTDDGAVTIRGGMGEAITLAGGNVLIDCPGSIVLRPGKGFITLAGDDAIIRARNSVDITSSKKDIRIKAEKNMQLLSANSGYGGMLIENRSQGSDQDYPTEGGEKIKGTGIIFKAPNAQIASLASEIYLRTGGEKELGRGSIYIDAGKDSDVVITARAHWRYAESQYIDSFGIDNVRSANTFAETATLLPGFLYATMGISTYGQVAAIGGMYSASGHFLSSFGGDVGKLEDPGSVESAISEASSSCDEGKNKGQENYDNQIKEGLYGEKRIGNEETIKSVSVGMRDEKQYGTEKDFMLPECYWQLLVGDQSNGVVSWEEPVVKYQSSGGEGGADTMPWPGQKAWNEDETLLSMSGDALTMFDLSKGVGMSRADEESGYTEGKLGEPKKLVAQKAYKVIDTKE